MHYTVFGLLAVIFSLIFFGLMSGCASAPTQEMSDARQAVSAAQDAGAERYAVGALSSAEMRLEKAEKALKRRTFRRARNDAIKAREEALKAKNIALAISDAKLAIEHAVTHGVSTFEAEKLLAQGEEAARQGDEQLTVYLSEKVVQNLDEPEKVIEQN